MRCPHCSSNDLKIEVSFSAPVACKFKGENDVEFELMERVMLNSHWNGESQCGCLNCNWTGMVCDASSSPVEVSNTGAIASESGGAIGWFTAEDQQELKHLLEAEECPLALRKHVKKLMSEVGRLSSLLDNMSRIQEKSGTTDGDTFVG